MELPSKYNTTLCTTETRGKEWLSLHSSVSLHSPVLNKVIVSNFQNAPNMHECLFGRNTVTTRTPARRGTDSHMTALVPTSSFPLEVRGLSYSVSAVLFLVAIATLTCLTCLEREFATKCGHKRVKKKKIASSDCLNCRNFRSKSGIHYDVRCNYENH